jgi:hypothetical protein
MIHYRHPSRWAIAALCVVGAAVLASGCTSSPTAAPKTMPAHSQPTVPWTDPTGVVSVHWTGGPAAAKKDTFYPGSPLAVYTRLYSTQGLVEHVTVATSPPSTIQQLTKELQVMCAATPVTWEGHPGLQCSGPYHLGYPLSIASRTITQLEGPNKITSTAQASQRIHQAALVVVVSPTKLVIVDAEYNNRQASPAATAFVATTAIQG